LNMWSKILKAHDAKTASVRRYAFWFAVLIIVVGTVFFTYHRFAKEGGRTLLSADKIFQLEVADDPAERKKGLSGRERLPEDAGLLFVFEQAGQHCFWMKDMRFSIDMLWLDAQKRVIKIQEAVAPETYPNSFCPDEPAKYVIELNAGVAGQADIVTGSNLQF